MSKLREIEEHLEAQRWEEAQAASRDFVDLQPAIPEGHAYLGLSEAHLGHLDQAVESLRKAFILKPHYWQAGLALADCLDRLGRYEEALSVAEQTAKDRPSDEAVLGLVRSLRRQVKPNRTDGWEVSRRQRWWMIDLKNSD